ncbi:hypothetical protein SAMN04487962_12524 [Marinobacter segnicrescens]|uniref:Uncharacterized protein n=1 Tax=Marinobacter segnicrescens TaxID=430453 RepID=A0A1I0H7X0_9GAMM|nr:hypothetical protein [Marinobacter segnicrescens]SET79857.1 hypothetical protein SAMN04487962_12524 [Marinobacter segnicrescens]
MADVKVIGLKDVMQRLRDAGPNAAQAAKDAIRVSMFKIQGKMSQRTKTGPLYSRTGELSRSFNSRVYGSTLDDIGGRVWTNSPYARIHETGGVINAKKAYRNLPGGPYLNIPASDNKTASGVMRMNAREAFNAGAFILPINSNKARYMILLNNKPMFWLVKSVTIKPRLEFKSTAEKEIPTLLSTINENLAKSL